MTTLATSLHIATSSLGATQVQLSVAANNIANADTDGYTTKSATQISLTSGGSGSGVSIAEIASNVSKILMTDLIDATSETAAATITQSYISNLQSALGSLSSETGEGSALSNTIAAFEDAMTGLATTPESASLANAAVAALEDVTNQINDTASDITDQIETADSQIATGVAEANEALETIDGLNAQIRTATARGDSTSDLQDQLNTALVALSEQMEIKTFTGTDGSTKVYSASGQVLVDSTSHLLTTDTDASGHVTISVNGSDITDKLDTGSLGALLTLRDETLPAFSEALDELANQLVTTLNTVQPGLLTGTSASDIAVSDSLLSDPTTLLGTANASETANAILDALQGDSSFNAAGVLSAGDRSFTDYVGEIISAAVSASTSASNSLDLSQTELSSIEDTIASIYGVNVDEETERLAELQQLYALASTILSTIQSMFDDLRSAVS